MTKKHTLSMIKIIQKLKPEQLDALLDNVSDNFVDELCECVYNVMHSEHVCAKLSKASRTKLKNHIKTRCDIGRIKKISNKKVSLSKRRKLLKQEGSGLGLILASVIPFLTSLFSPKS